ncbi:hypothetical protein Cpap_2939 [Ruminiclostridium papyrosolvens DSM 2782]|uniref:Uncharacterized protein n=1 Tax=Ruminiclostridium papyrosolvens DSM 2782 TaxID=588581 RepID=F1TAH4_9FIRM|nr:hypothetical protein Cpap_2939 [Ruminiclostridium papyrosolvens DSM 2782]
MLRILLLNLPSYISRIKIRTNEALSLIINDATTNTTTRTRIIFNRQV